MPKKELSPEEQINQAVEDVRQAMLNKIKADKALTHAGIKKEKARYVLQKAKERLNALEIEYK